VPLSTLLFWENVVSQNHVKRDPYREKLSEFLKSCRARVTPADLGLPDKRRRRTPGLRREDVATLAGVSVSWYTWLEQGRDIQVSSKVLERISTTLRMTEHEREYLYALAQRRPPPPTSRQATEVSAMLQGVLDAVPFPALVTNERWDVLAWNEPNRRIFYDYSKLPVSERNIFRVLMLNDDFHLNPEEYEATVRNIVPKFRVDYSQATDVASFEALIDELLELCPTFREHWNSPNVTWSAEGIDDISHPELGGINYVFSSYVPEAHPSLRVWFFVPNNDETRQKFHTLMNGKGN
jgi:transcriptional regulator with XRE-family HTH domain